MTDIPDIRSVPTVKSSDVVDSKDGLRAHIGNASPMAENKVLRHLDHYCQGWIKLSPFMVIGTCDAEGNADVSPRGDPAGFVITDERTMFVPDRPGNKRMDTYLNVISNPSVGTIFFVPGFDEVLRVNGRAQVVRDEELLSHSEVQGKVPKTGLLIEVKEAFFHCSKAIKRGRLWDVTAQLPRESFPSLGRITADHTQLYTAEEAENIIQERIRTRMY